MPAPYALAIEFTPSTLRRIIDCVSQDRYAEPLEAGRFSLIEMVAHIADGEDVFLDRMRTAKEFPGTTVEFYDMDQRAADKAYAQRNLQHELDVFENRRRDTLDFLKNLEEGDWQKTFIHPQRGELSIENQVTMLLGHDLYHLEQASHYIKPDVHFLTEATA